MRLAFISVGLAALLGGCSSGPAAPTLEAGTMVVRPAASWPFGATPRYALAEQFQYAGDSAEGSGPYTPHVTVGLYGGAWPTADVQSRLDGFDRHPAIHCHIERLSLMSYAAPEIGGPLATLADFCLVTRQLVWAAGRPLAGF